VDQADFLLRLHEQVNYPARRAAAAIDAVRSSLVGTQKEVAKTERALAGQFSKQQKGKSGYLLGGGGAGGLVAGVATGSLLATGIEKVAELGLAAGEVVMGLGERFIEAAGEGLVFAQNMRLSFGFLTHDAALGASTFEDVRKEAQGLALDVHETVDSFRALLAAQFSIGASHDLVKMAADMQAVGASAEEVQRILYAVREIKDIGSLQQRQVRMLEMAGISGALINKHLQERLGAHSPHEVEKLRKGGKIGADVGIAAIQDAVKEKLGENALGDVAAKMGQSTLSGMFRTSKAEIDNAFITLGEQLEPGATRIGQRMFATFQKVVSSASFAQAGDKVVEGFGRAVDWIDAHWETIDGAITKTADFIAGGLTSTIDFFEAHWDQMATGLSLGADIIKGIATDFQIVGAVLQWLGGGIMAVDNYLIGLMKTITGARDELQGFARIMGPALQAAGVFIPGAGLLGTAISTSAVSSGVDGAISDAADASKKTQLQSLGPTGTLSPLASNIPEGAVKQIRVGDIHVPVQALDLDDPEGAGTKIGGLIKREILNVIEHA
jgi:hypothetical protein